MTTTIVAAVGRNGVIGVGGRLPWRIPADLARFKEMTLGHVLVMGRATFESIGRPLPGRTNIVLTRKPDWAEQDVLTAASMGEALEIAAGTGNDVFLIGGAEVYRNGLAFADRMELTEVDESPLGDTWFPEVDWEQWSETSRQKHPGYAFVTYERVARA